MRIWCVQRSKSSKFSRDPIGEREARAPLSGRGQTMMRIEGRIAVMFRHSFCYLIGFAFLIALMSRAPAQDKDKEPPKPPPKKDPFDEYRQFLKPPVTVPE